jgi:general secretion pathway protein G
MVVKKIVSRRKNLVRSGKSQSGFTLLELLLVLFLMGIILTSFNPHFGSAANQVRSRVNLANVQKIEGAAQLYRIDVGTYPLSVSDLVHAPKGVSGWRGPYLDETPINPFNCAQGYQIDALGQVK